MSTRRKSAVGLGSPGNTKARTSSMSFNNFNIKNETLRNETKGTKPATNPTTIKEVLTMMILHICKKTIFFDIKLKVGLYIMCLFLISLIGGKSFHFSFYFIISSYIYLLSCSIRKISTIICRMYIFIQYFIIMYHRTYIYRRIDRENYFPG